MLLRVDADLPLPVYEQIRVQVARLAVSGQTAAGTRLPTIERAYELLEGDGVVERRGRAGTFLRVRPTSGAAAHGLAELDEAADALAVIVRQLGAEEADAHDALTRAFDRLR